MFFFLLRDPSFYDCVTDSNSNISFQDQLYKYLRYLDAFCKSTLNILSQQMGSSDCTKIEDGDLRLLLLPSNFVGSYNYHQINLISNEPSTVIDSLIIDTYSLSPAELMVVRSDNAL